MTQKFLGNTRRATLSTALLFILIRPASAIADAPPPGDTIAELEEVTVTASRLDLIGTATTASEGIVVDAELTLTPAYRPGQLLETVPGLAVTQHSGEGKANQYLLRGYNLDHGTDLATFVDGMPVNQPTHAHGQGYTDLNFLIPELATNVSYTKGTYYADEGDFASVGSVHIQYRDSIPTQLSLTTGSWGFERFLAGGSTAAADGELLGALEFQTYNGPWLTPGDQRKVNAVLRYSKGTETEGYSLTASFNHGSWNNQSDQPERAITEGLISSPFAELDTSDRGTAQRLNLSWQYAADLAGGQLRANGYLFNNELTLFNDFTHFLLDPVNGDQEDQHEDRATFGGGISYAHGVTWLDVDHQLRVGLQLRYDFADVSRTPSKDAMPIPAADDPLNVNETDQIRLASNAAYLEVSSRWTDWMRTIVAVREDYQYGHDSGTNSGDAGSALFEPKGSVIFRPASRTEFYVSAGRGFHSDDLRGVTHAAKAGVPGAPLLASQTGAEVGVRQEFANRSVTLTAAVFDLEAQSETTYDPDIGQDFAGPASRRQGYEINATWQALPWLELYGSFSRDRARYKTPYDDGTGHLGEYLPNAPFATGSFNVYVNNLGPWSGGLAYRYLGAYPLSSGPCANSAVVRDFPGLTSCANAPTLPGQINGSGYGEWSADIRYAMGGGWTGALGVYNLLNKKANAMEYWYVDRLPGEDALGRADLHVHPLEPFSMRLTIAKQF